MYTSGTTGDPKGVMISNESIISIIYGVNDHLDSMNEKFTEEDVYLSYLPLAHIFDRVIGELMIFAGSSIGFWHKDVKELIDDIRELRPTVLPVVPRVLDRIHSDANMQYAELLLVGWIENNTINSKDLQKRILRFLHCCIMDLDFGLTTNTEKAKED